MNAVIVNFVE